MKAQPPTAIPHNVAIALGSLFPESAIRELRVLGCDDKPSVRSGWYSEPAVLAQHAAAFSGIADSVCVTINPIAPNAHTPTDGPPQYHSKTTTNDDILSREVLLIDIDPHYAEKGHPATDEEHEAAHELARTIATHLSNDGWPEAGFVDSGNGVHLLYRINLSADDGGLVERCLLALSRKYDSDSAHVDTAPHHPAALMRVPGTLNRKGSEFSGRCHKASMMLKAPAAHVVTRESLDSLASQAPTLASQASINPKSSDGTALDVEAWMSRHGILVHKNRPWQGGTLWELQHCPWKPDATDGGAHVIQFPNGAVAFGCHHNSCQGYRWAEFRHLIEPDYRGAHGSRRTATISAVPSPNRHAANKVSWPDPLDDAAFYGLTGDFVRTVEPHSEADPVALLVHFQVAFGNCIGRGPHFRAEDSQHFTNEDAVLVGNTAKGRKGTSWGSSRRLFRAVDEAWSDRCQHAGLSSGEGLIYLVRDEVTQQKRKKKQGVFRDEEEVVVDPGAQDKRALILEEEFSSPLKVMSRQGNTLSPVLRSAWDGRDLQTLTRKEPLKASTPHVSIVGHITRDELRRHLTETEQGNGFGNRFCWYCVRRSKVLPEGGRVADEQMIPLGIQVANAVSFARQVGEITRDNEARALWHDVYGALSEGKPGLLGAMTARAEAHVMRHACLYALLDQSALIRRPHLEAALALWRYAEASTAYIFGDALGDPVADEILSALRRSSEGLDRTDIANLLSRHPSRERIDQALALLRTNKLADCRSIPTQGRPREVWFAIDQAPAR